jgi:hypothetical protein
MSTNTQRIAAELLACADALRAARTQLCRLVHEGHPLVQGQPETGLVLVAGRDVIDGLEALAGRLGETGQH